MENLPVDSTEAGAAPKVQVPLEGRSMAQILDEAERQVLAWAMTEAQGNQSRAAQLLGIAYSTFKAKLARHNLRATWS